MDGCLRVPRQHNALQGKGDPAYGRSSMHYSIGRLYANVADGKLYWNAGEQYDYIVKTLVWLSDKGGVFGFAEVRFVYAGNGPGVSISPNNDRAALPLLAFKTGTFSDQLSLLFKGGGPQPGVSSTEIDSTRNDGYCNFWGSRYPTYPIGRVAGSITVLKLSVVEILETSH